MSRRGAVDHARMTAWSVLRQVSSHDAYANLALSEALQREHLGGHDAALVTELVSGTTRWRGTYDLIVERAGGRSLRTLQPAVVDVLRMGTHELLGMNTPTHAAVSMSVEVARAGVGERATGVVNAIVRRIGQHDLAGWLDLVAAGLSPHAALGVRTAHPAWIVDAFADVLPEPELRASLDADNRPPETTLAVRPGLCTVQELVDGGARPTRFSPFGATRPGSPSELAAVRESRAGVQDEGSQLVAWAATRAAAPAGRWLDLCAGPGGKSALLAGLAGVDGSHLVAAELQPHRATLVAHALAGYPADRWDCVVADGTRPPWAPGSFTRVLADVPCTGLGALRRRPDARWRKSEGQPEELHALQRALLATAIDSVSAGGVVAYATCSPHRRETADVVAETVAERDGVEILDAPGVLSQVPDCRASTDPRFVQLWPHRHGTDAMFLALLRRTA